jgi:hypothetical protein
MKTLASGCALALGLFALLGSPAHAADSLYIGDDSDYTVKRFDAETGAFLSSFVSSGSGGVNGLRGLLFEHPSASGCGDLLLVNQNVNFNLNGEVLQYNGTTGAFLKALIPAADAHGPYAPRGIVLWNDTTLFVADQGNPPAAGKLLAYATDGTFLADLTPARPEFHPRAVVVGPDGKLYVTVRNLEFCGGSVLRFDPATRQFLDVFITNPVDCNQNVNDLHRPEGLVFGPDGNLYIASRFRDGTDTDKIVIFQGPGGSHPGAELGSIPLDDINFVEMSAQTLLFGPGGKLFVPISDINQNGDENTTVNGPDTGSVRRYDVDTKTFDVFVLPSAQGGPLRSPWYLTFGKTDPGTLAYDEQHASCGAAAPIVSPTSTLTPAAATATPTLPPSGCVGDCSGAHTVAVNNIISLVNIALGNEQPSTCGHGIPSGADVTVALIIQAVNNALNGCPPEPTLTPTPTPTHTPTFSATATITPTAIFTSKTPSRTPTRTPTSTSTPKVVVSGACSNPTKPDGTSCDASLDGSPLRTCTGGTCGPCVPPGRCSTTSGAACAFDQDCPSQETCVHPRPGHCSVTPSSACAFDQDCPPDEGMCVPANPRFVDNGDGTITDRQTCLVWEKKDNAHGLHEYRELTYPWSGQCSTDSSVRCQRTIAASMACGTALGCAVCPTGTCKTLSDRPTIWEWLLQLNQSHFALHSDWRIPSSAGPSGYQSTPPNARPELESLRDFGIDEPIIDPIFTVNCSLGGGRQGGNDGCTVDGARGTQECSCTLAACFWSSTTASGPASAIGPDDAWAVEFSYPGGVGLAGKLGAGEVRAVRGGW